MNRWMDRWMLTTTRVSVDGEVVARPARAAEVPVDGHAHVITPAIAVVAWTADWMDGWKKGGSELRGG